ncbi:MAG: flippase [Candidatus Omnitrophica bacterium]|nr:flippase [Candidatus Omnitrophota bacterium]
MYITKAGTMTGLKVTKNTVSLIMREALNKGSLFLLLILIGRVMGREALGRYSLAIAISQIFFFGTELGLNTLVVREVAKDRLLAEKFLVNMGALRVVTGLITLAMIWATVSMLGARGEAAAAIYLCAVSCFFINIANLYTSILRAVEKMELELLIAFLRNLAFLPVAVWMILNNLGIVGVFNIFLVSNVLGLIIAGFIVIKEIGMPPDWRLDFTFWRKQLVETSPLWLSQLFGIAYLKVAPLLLFRLKGEEAVGLYNAGFVVVDGLWVAAGCFVYSVFPIISRSGRSEARKEYVNGARIVLFGFLAAAGFIWIMSGSLAPLVYGKNFRDVAPLFRIFAIASVFIALNTHNGMTIIAIRRQLILPLINASGLLINFMLNIFLIPRFGFMGSAYALLLSAVFVFFCTAFALRRCLK